MFEPLLKESIQKPQKTFLRLGSKIHPLEGYSQVKSPTWQQTIEHTDCQQKLTVKIQARLTIVSKPPTQFLQNNNTIHSQWPKVVSAR